MINKLIIKKVQIEMVLDRGYNIPDSEMWILDENVGYLKNKRKIKLNNYYQKNEDTLYVYYINEDEELYNKLKKFVKKMSKHDYGILVGINEKEITQSKYIKIFENFDKPFQVFEYDELSYNVTKHINYSKHELIDKSTIIPKMANLNQLPILSLSDPVTKYFNWKTGDIIKITHKYDDLNLISIDDITYRVVSPHYYYL